MTNVLDLLPKLEERLTKEFQKHLDLAEISWEQGDEVAYDDHMKMSESILSKLKEL